MNQTLSSWEHHETERSASEAMHRQSEDLLIDESILSRYFAPPISTAFPLEYAYAILGDVKGKSILDYGCGAGDNTVLLANREGIVTGVDISPELIELAQTRINLHQLGNNVQFKVGSAHNLPFNDNTFDVVFGMAILHHLDLELSSKEVYRVLKPGGYAIFMEPVRNSKVFAFLRNLIPYKSPDVSEFERPLLDAELVNYAKGFSSYESKGFCLPFINLFYFLNFPFSIMKIFQNIDSAAIRLLPFLKFYSTSRVIIMHK